MRLLKTIREQDIDPAASDRGINYILRRAARAVAFDDNNKVGLIKVEKLDYYKLPGGGLEKGEDIKTALAREVREELGCNIKVVKELGSVEEFRGRWNLRNLSYCYLARVEGLKGNPAFTDEEKDKGFKIEWLDLNKAISLVRNSKPVEYEGRFVVIRDLLFLEEAKLCLN